MHLNRKQQLKVPYQDYLLLQGRQIISQMTPASRQHLLDTIQARAVIGGEKVADSRLVDYLKEQDNA